MRLSRIVTGTPFRERQCCGTVTFYYGSGSSSDFWQVPVPDPAPHLNLAFLMLKEPALLPRNLSNEGNQIQNFILRLWVLFWFHFITVSIPVPLRQKVTVPMVPVPVPQHWVKDVIFTYLINMARVKCLILQVYEKKSSSPSIPKMRQILAEK